MEKTHIPCCILHSLCTSIHSPDSLLSAYAEMASPGSGSGPECLPSPPPAIPPNVVPIKAEELKINVIPELPKRHPKVKPGIGIDGGQIKLLSSHFHVVIKSYDMCPVEGKGIRRMVMDKLYQMYRSELAGKNFSYDGEKGLFTVGALPQNNFEFTVVLEELSARAAGGSPGHGSPSEGDRKCSKRAHQPRTFKVEISYAAKIPMRSIVDAIQGRDAEHTQDAFRVLDIILRQQQAKRGCLLVRQSFFSGGATGCWGFHSSFCTTIGGLTLNMDVSTPGPVVELLCANQIVREACDIDGGKAKRILKNTGIKTTHGDMEFKIIGIRTCRATNSCSR